MSKQLSHFCLQSAVETRHSINPLFLLAQVTFVSALKCSSSCREASSPGQGRGRTSKPSLALGENGLHNLLLNSRPTLEKSRGARRAKSFGSFPRTQLSADAADSRHKSQHFFEKRPLTLSLMDRAVGVRNSCLHVQTCRISDEGGQ